MDKGLRVLGHPVHAMLSDFPLALLGTSLLWDVIGIYRSESVWWAISFWNIVLGLVTALAAATAGAIDYAAIKPKSPAVPLATTHMLLMLTAVSLYVVSLLMRGGPAPVVGGNRILVLILEGLGLITLVAGGWCGGHLVFHHGIGRDQTDDT